MMKYSFSTMVKVPVSCVFKQCSVIYCWESSWLFNVFFYCVISPLRGKHGDTDTAQGKQSVICCQARFSDRAVTESMHPTVDIAGHKEDWVLVFCVVGHGSHQAHSICCKAGCLHGLFRGRQGVDALKQEDCEWQQGCRVLNSSVR